MKGYIAHWKLLEGGEVDYQVLGLATALLPGKKPGPCTPGPFLQAVATSRVRRLLRRRHPIDAARLGIILLCYRLLQIRGRLWLSGSRFIAYQLRW